MTGWLLQTLLYTGVLIALVLVLRRPVGRVLGAKAAYALWALPLVRLVLPPLVLPASMAPEGEPIVVHTAALLGQAAPAAGELAAVSPSAELVTPANLMASPPDPVAVADPVAGPLATLATALPWFDLMLATWLAGGLTFLAWRVHTYRRMRREVLAGARSVGEIGKIRLVETPAVGAPVAFGVIDKVIALPVDFMAWHDREGRDLAIAHELEHHRGRDLLANYAAQALLALHWFNPLAWIGWRAMRRDQEAACDARVLDGRGRDERVRYATLIARAAAGPRLALAAPLACPIASPILGETSIVHRLRSIQMPELTRRRRWAGRLLLAGSALALPLTASVTYAAQSEEATAPEVRKQHKMIIVDKDGGAAVDDNSLIKHMVTRDDGTTVELRTDKQLTDDEARARVDRAFASMAEMDARQARRIAIVERRRAEGDAALPPPPLPPLPPQAARAPLPPMPAMPQIELRFRDDHNYPEFRKQMEQYERDMEKWGEAYGAQVEKWAELHGEDLAKWGDEFGRSFAFNARVAPEVIESCDEREQARARTSDGRPRVVICQREIRQAARSSLRGARASIAGNASMDPAVRDEVLRNLDREIERIESDTSDK